MDVPALVTLISNPSPLLLEELVLSADSLADVATRHNLSEEVLTAAYVNPVFSAKLAEAKRHHEKTGEFHRTLARHKFQDALDNAHTKATDIRTSPKDAIAWVETLAGLSGIKQAATQASGSAEGRFVFNINFGNAGNGKPVTIEGEVVADAPPPSRMVNTLEDLPTVSLAPVEIEAEVFEFTD